MTGRKRVYPYEPNKQLSRFKLRKVRDFVFIVTCLILVSGEQSHKSKTQAITHEKKELRVGYYDLPPHSFYEQGGASRDFLDQSILKPLGYQIKWVQLPFKRMLVWLENQQIDLGILIAATPERKSRMNFSRLPILNVQPAFVVKQNHPLQRITNLGQLKGMTVGHTSSSIQPTYLQQQGIDFSVVSSPHYFEQNVRRLKADRIEAIFAPTASHARYKVQKLGMESQLRILLLPVDRIPLHFAFSKALSSDFTARFDQQHALVADQYESYLAPYLNQAAK